MCDPVSLSIASTVVGAAGTAMNAFGAMNAQKKQKREVEAWAQRQTQMRGLEKVRQEGFRRQAAAAQQKGLADVAAEAQAKKQSEEEGRLTNYLTGEEGKPPADQPATPVSAVDETLTQTAGGQADPMRTDLAKRINEATTSAKQRIAALARASSYGGSSGGLGTVIPMAQSRAGAGIDQQNEYRRGSMSAYATERAVDPVQVSFQPSPLADIFSTALSFGSQGLGNTFGKKTFGSYPKAPGPSTFIGPAKPLPPYLSTTQGLF